jgi:hypothetical protein
LVICLMQGKCPIPTIRLGDNYKMIKTIEGRKKVIQK